MALTVLQVLPALNEGGVERGTLEIARGLVARGHRSIVLSADGRLVRQLREEGSEHIAGSIGSKTPLVLLWVHRLRRLLHQLDVDIVHARSRLPAWICYWALRGIDQTRRPHFVTTVHGLYSVNRYSAVMMKGDVVIAVSDTIRSYITNNYPGVDGNKVQLIYRGIDREQFPHRYRPTSEWLQRWYRCYPELKNRFVVTLPGRLSRQKGHEEFLAVIANAVNEGLEVAGVVVGEISRKNDYAKALKEHGRATQTTHHLLRTSQRHT